LLAGRPRDRAAPSDGPVRRFDSCGTYHAAAVAALHLVVDRSEQGGEGMGLELPACTGERQAATGEDLREVARRFPRGVAVVSALVGNDARAMTVDSFTTVSLDPLLVLVAVSRGGQMHAVLTASDGFGLSILGEHQEWLARHFADGCRPSGWAQFATVPWWQASSSGAPLLHESLGWLDCRTYDVLPGGDHALVLGEVMHAHVGARRAPLLRFDGAYRRLRRRRRDAKSTTGKGVKVHEEDRRT